MFVDYYELLDKNMDKMKENELLKNKLKEYFCHHSYRKRFAIDEKFLNYCKFFQLDYDYMIKNTVDNDKLID